MNISEIMNLIDKEKLEELGTLYKVDKINNKITGKFIVKNFVKCVLMKRAVSLRSLEMLCNNSKELSELLKSKRPNKKQVDHSSIGKRLESINVKYFQGIYEDLVNKYNNKFAGNDKQKFNIFDSTIISLSSKLLKDGINAGGKETARHIKISVGLKNSIANSIRFCNGQSEVSEDIALVKAINEAKIEKEDVLLFDRGVSSADSFRELDKQEKKFITRIKLNRKYHLVKRNDIVNAGNLDITSDEIVNLYNKKHQKINCNLRLIKAKNVAKDELWFLTNILDLSAEELAESYKERWSIGVFFKFIKQNLQFKNFVSHNMNGMQVYLYCILIAAILFIIFKISNKLTGFKMALLKFTLFIEKELIKDIVLFCGGNPNLVELKI